MNPEQVRNAIVKHFAYGEGIDGSARWWPNYGCSCASCLDGQGCEVPELVLDVTGLEATSSPVYDREAEQRQARQRADRSVVDMAMSMPYLTADTGKLWAFGQNVNPRSDA